MGHCLVEITFRTVTLVKFKYFLFCFVGCSGSTVVYEKGSTICLPFTVNQSNILFTIKRDSVKLCILVRGTVFKPESELKWRNETYNCNGSGMVMSVCFGDSQSEDAGLFSLYDGTTNESTIIQNITLQITSMIFSISYTSLFPLLGKKLLFGETFLSIGFQILDFKKWVCIGPKKIKMQ